MDKKQPKKEPTPNNENVIVGGVIVGAIIIVAIVLLFTGFHKNNDVNMQKAANISQTAKTTSEKDTAQITQNDAEKYCENAGLLQNYVNVSKTDIVTLSYAPVFIDSLGSYTKEGRPIYNLSWNGKNKDTGASVWFDCYVSRTKGGNIQLDRIGVDGDYFDAHDFYNKDGSVQKD